MRTEIAFCFCILLFVNCGSEKSAPTTTAVAASGSGGNVDAGATANQQLATTSAPLTVAGSAAATVTRHLPGTAITTATGKYTYLVQSDGSIASFISDAVATASGYPTAMIITVSAAELYCYGRGDQITAALPAPKAGKLRDGTLVKEKGKSDTYVVSDSAAWPVMNGNVFAEAGYDWGNVIEISAGTLVKSVEAVGDCVAGIACLDEAYLTSCSQDIVNNDPPTSTSTPTATATATAPTTSNQQPTTNVTRHLPGTAITTATGKYTYLVQSDGTIASFASDAIASASGYPAAMIITVSTSELYCYGRSDQITAALPAPKAGKLRDGTLVKEKGKSDTYAVSDGAAWPIMNGNVFAEAGYNWDNVIEIASGTLAKSVEAVGDCIAEIACLDEAYLTSCSQDIVNTDPPSSTSSTTSTATAIATATPSATATATGISTAATTTNVAAATVTRHLPGTAITTATGKYTYLVQSDGSIASFTSSAIASASGYPTTMIITVSAAELYCYSHGDQITAALPAPKAGKLRDGTLVKENGKSDTYVVSDGIAWPVMNGNVFTEAGYAWENVIEIASGTLAASVDSVGNCVTGIACLDEAYLTSCSQDETIAPLSTSTATSVATSTPVATATATATATTIQTSLTITTVNTGSAIATSTGTATNTQSATTTASPDAAPSAVNNPDASVDVSVDTRAPQDAVTATVTVTNNQQPGTIDLSWVYAALGSQLCLNAAYFDGNNKAVLLVWSGPGADSFKGSVAAQTNDRFCWEFAGKGKGLYYFWADAPDPACSAAVCQRDGIDGNGAIYMTAPKASVAARKWLHCEPTGCDGAAYWDGTMLTPMGD